MSDVVLLESVINCCGVRQAHLMRMGQEIGRQEWVNFVPGEVPISNVALFDWHEKDLDVHHLRLSWLAREVVKVGIEPMVWWWVAGMSASLAIDCAAGLYFERMGQVPDVALMRKIPSEAPDKVKISCGDEVVLLDLVQAEWVPGRFVVVGRGMPRPYEEAHEEKNP